MMITSKQICQSVTAGWTHLLAASSGMIATVPDTNEHESKPDKTHAEPTCRRHRES
jgi:hypothetical protein